MRLRDLVRDRSAGLFTLIVLLFFIQPLTTQTFFFRDLYRLFYGRKLLFADAVRAATFPLWDPLTHGGQPYLAEPGNFAFHPSNLLYLVMPAILAFNLVIALHVLFCAVAAYWLARTMGVGKGGAFVAGSVYAFSGVSLSTASLIPLLLALPWIPLTIGLAHRALQERRSLIPAALAAAMPLFCSAAEVTAMMGVTLLVWVAACRYPISSGRKAFGAALVLAAAIGISLVATLPVTRLLANSPRGDRFGYRSFSAWSVSPVRLGELAVPRFFGPGARMDSGDYWGRNHENAGYPYLVSLYLGVPVLLLAVAGAFGALPGSGMPRRALAAVALAAVILSLGRSLPLFKLLFETFPIVGIFRFPVKAQIAALLPVALLAGAGVDVVSRSTRAARGVLAASVAALLAALAIGGSLLASAPFSDALAAALSFTPLDELQRMQLARSFGHTAVAAVGIAAAAQLAARGSVRAGLALAAVVAADLLAAGFPVNPYAPRALFDPPPLALRVHEAIGMGRFHAQVRTVASIPPGDGSLLHLARWQLGSLHSYNAATFGIPVVFHDDYDGLAPRPIVTLGSVVQRLSWNHAMPLLDRAGVTVFLARGEIRLPGLQTIGVLAGGDGPLVLHRNGNAVIARFVSKVTPAKDDREALSRLLGAKGLEEVVLVGAEPRTHCGAAGVRLLERNLNVARYSVEAPCDGYVVFAENHAEGWRARVDGRPVELVRADYAFTAIAVSRGTHTIERRYFPALLVQGLIATMTTLLLLIAADRWWWRGAPRATPVALS